MLPSERLTFGSAIDAVVAQRLARRLCDDCRDEEDEHGDDHLREVAENDIADEEVNRREVEYIKRRYQEGDDKEPLHEETEELAGIELETCAREHVLQARGLERLINAKRIDDLGDNATETDADEPSDDEDDYCND
jgi:type II secretory ATPase GspE/PulE/Tfp pilus assembly ATPase PilB-like protein